MVVMVVLEVYTQILMTFLHSLMFLLTFLEELILLDLLEGSQRDLQDQEPDLLSVLKMRTALMGKHVTLELMYVLMLLKFQAISSTMELRDHKEQFLL